jgi:hypothetical protein
MAAIDFLGEQPEAARAVPLCRVGFRSYGFDLCAERFMVPDLLSRILARDPTIGDP